MVLSPESLMTWELSRKPELSPLLAPSRALCMLQHTYVLKRFCRSHRKNN